MMPQGGLWYQRGNYQRLSGGVVVITNQADARFLRGILFALIAATLATGLMAAIASGKAGPAPVAISSYGL
jgi:hypothetical protein